MSPTPHGSGLLHTYNFPLLSFAFFPLNLLLHVFYFSWYPVSQLSWRVSRRIGIIRGSCHPSLYRSSGQLQERLVPTSTDLPLASHGNLNTCYVMWNEDGRFFFFLECHVFSDKPMCRAAHPTSTASPQNTSSTFVLFSQVLFIFFFFPQQRKAGDAISDSRSMTSLMATSTTSLVRRISTQTSVGQDDIDVVTSPEAANAQSLLLQVLACCLDVVAHFSPDLAQVLLDQVRHKSPSWIFIVFMCRTRYDSLFCRVSTSQSSLLFSSLRSPHPHPSNNRCRSERSSLLQASASNPSPRLLPSLSYPCYHLVLLDIHVNMNKAWRFPLFSWIFAGCLRIGRVRQTLRHPRHSRPWKSTSFNC